MVLELKNGDDRGKAYEVVLPQEFGQMPSIGQKLHVQLRVISGDGKRAVAEFLTAF